MRKTLWWWGLACLLSWMPGWSLAASSSSSVPVILVYGDSLSAAYGMAQNQGWVHLLSKELAGRYQVINASVSGETTAGGLARLPAALQRHRPALVVLELGANDGLRGLPMDLAQSNLDAMLRQIQRSGAKVLLVGMQLPPNYGKPYSDKFQAMYQALAQQHRVPFMPFLLDGFALDGRQFQTDQLHPTAEAQPVILRHVMQYLQPLLPGRAATAKSRPLPQPPAKAPHPPKTKAAPKAQAAAG